MAKALQRRRGTNEEHKNFTGLEGEFTYDTTEKRIVAHDGLTAGGVPMAKVSEVNEVQTNLTNAKSELQGSIDSLSDVYLGKTATASSANKLATARSIGLGGDASGSASFDGSGDVVVSATLANSGVSAGSYGPSDNASPAHSGTFTVPYVTVDAKGRVTGASNKTITLPAVTLPDVGAQTYVDRANYTNKDESKHSYNSFGTTTNSNTGGMSSPTYVYKYYTAAKRDAYGRLTGVGVWTYKSYCNCNCQD